MVGTTVTWDELVAIAEKVTRRKFLVKYNSIEELEEIARSEDRFVKLMTQIRVSFAKGGYECKPVLNEMCPEVKSWGLEGWLEKWWGGVDLPEPAWGEGGYGVRF